MHEGFESARARMVERQLRKRDISDERVLHAMATVPRHEFVPPADRRRAYADCALPLINRATISQPYIVALMAQALRLEGSERVLEIGTGSGYSTAVLAELAETVVSVELDPQVAELARENLRRVGVTPMPEVITGDGSLGHPEGAPYDAISITATAPRIPEALLAQLRPRGWMVLPRAMTTTDVSPRAGAEELVAVRASGDGLEVIQLALVRFVPLRGMHGYPD